MPNNPAVHTDAHELSANSVHGAADLTSKQELFSRAYAQGCSVVEAYRFAYNVGEDTAAATARNNGYKLLNRPKVGARVRELQEAAGAHSLKSAASLIGELEQMIDADLNELMQLVVGSCRRCHGAHGFYQWHDEMEYARAIDDSALSGTAFPDASGGFGYKFDRDPNPECPACDGAGIQRVRFTNTADLSPGVRRLFRGIDLFPDGSVKRVLLHDQMAARIELHRLKGMHVDRSLSLTAHVSVPALKELSAEQALDFLESLRPTRRAPMTIDAPSP